MDTLVKVNNEIEKAFKMKELMVIVFFDIEKAYDSVEGRTTNTNE